MLQNISMMPLLEQRTNRYQAPKTAIRFGWNSQELKRNPDLYTVTLKEGEDITHKANGEAMPTDKLGSKIAKLLARNGNLSVPGFAYIPNLSDFLNAANNTRMYERAHHFIEELNRKVFSHLVRLVPAMGQWQSQMKEESFYRPDGKPQNAAGKKFPQKNSLKSFHKDPHSVIATHVYGPVEGIEGGALMILDDQQLAHDEHLHFTDFYQIRPDMPNNIPCTPLIKEEWAKKLNEHSPQIFTVDTHPGKTARGLDHVPIFVFNNLELGHGATNVKVLDPATAKRGFYRSSMKASKAAAKAGPLKFLPFHRPDLHKPEEKD